MISDTSIRLRRALRGHAAARGLRALLLTLLVVGVAPFAPAWSAEAPQINVLTPRIAPDDQLQVLGRGFAAGQEIQIEVCGAPDASGSLTCTPMTEPFETPLNGTFAEDLVMAAPSGPCPCRLAVRMPGAPPVVTSIQLLNHPVADRVQTPEIVVDSARVRGATGLSALFTGRASGDLELELRNVGVTKASPTLLLEVDGKETVGSGEAVDDPGVAGIGPGSAMTVSVPVEVSSFGGGTHTISGYVVVGDMYEPVSTSVTVRPWGLYLVLVGAVAGAVAVFRRRRAPVPKPARARVQSTPGRRAARSDRRSRVPVVNMGEVARAASGASKAALEVIAKARAAEQAEQTEQVAVARNEEDDRETAARLEALGRRNEPVQTRVLPPLPVLGSGTPAPPTPAPASVVSSRVVPVRSAPAPASAPTPVVPAQAAAPAQVSADPAVAQRPQVPLPGRASAWSGSGPSGVVVTPQRKRSRAERSTAPEPEELVGPPRLERTPIDRPAWMAVEEETLPAAHLVEAGTGAALRETPGVATAPDASVVADAMSAIREHTAETPARLPDPYAYVPQQRSRRAPKGGKRAAR